MPTKDRLEDIDEEIVRYLLHKYCSDKYDGWRLLLCARNMCSHNIYNAEDIKENIYE